MRRRLRIPVALLTAGTPGHRRHPARRPVRPATGNPVTMTNGFYVDPGNSAAVWAAAHPTDGREPAIKSAIATKPDGRSGSPAAESAIGTSTGAYVGAAAANAGQLPVLVAYNIPDRDVCAGQSAAAPPPTPPTTPGSARFAGGIADRPALVILEPDALADESCMNSSQISDRDGLLKNAITQFTNQSPNTWVYLDAGNPGWISGLDHGRLPQRGRAEPARTASRSTSRTSTPSPRTSPTPTQVNADLQRPVRLHQAVRRRHQPRRQRLQRPVVQPRRPQARPHRPAGRRRRDAAVDQDTGRVRRQLRHRHRRAPASSTRNSLTTSSTATDSPLHTGPPPRVFLKTVETSSCRPALGKMHTLDAEALARRYPGCAGFLRVRNEADPGTHSRSIRASSPWTRSAHSDHVLPCRW